MYLAWIEGEEQSKSVIMKLNQAAWMRITKMIEINEPFSHKNKESRIFWN